MKRALCADIIFLSVAVFCLFYVFHGLLRERIYELYVLIIAIIVVLLYCIVEYAFLNVDGRTTIKLVSTDVCSYSV